MRLTAAALKGLEPGEQLSQLQRGIESGRLATTAAIEIATQLGLSEDQRADLRDNTFVAAQYGARTRKRELTPLAGNSAIYAGKKAPSIAEVSVEEPIGKTTITLAITGMKESKLAKLLAEKLRPVGTSKINFTLGDSENRTGIYYAWAEPGGKLGIGKGDGPGLVNFRRAILARETEDLAYHLGKLGIDISDAALASIAEKLWSPEGAKTRHAVKGAEVRSERGMQLHLDVGSKKQLEKLLDRRLEPLGRSATTKYLGAGEGGWQYWARVGDGGALVIGKARREEIQPDAVITAKELPLIQARLAAIGVDLPDASLGKIAQKLWAPEGAVTRHAATAASAKPFAEGTNLELRIARFDGTKLGELLARRLERISGSYNHRLGDAPDGGVYYAYAGADGTLVVGKGMLDGESNLTKLRPIPAAELDVVIAQLAAIGIDVPRRFERTMKASL